MTDRNKPGKARAWSPRRAALLLAKEQLKAWLNGWDKAEVDERALSRAYLCGFAAGLEGTTTYAEEWMRLGMAPTGKGKSKDKEKRK